MPWLLHVRTSQLIIAGDACGIQGDCFPGAWQWNTSDGMLMEIFGLTNKSDRMYIKNNIFRGCYFVAVLCICGNIRNMKCTVIAQARFHFTCNILVQKINVLYKYKCSYTFFCVLWLFSTNIHFFFYKTLISMVDYHDEKTNTWFDQCSSHNEKILYILVALAKLLTR